MESSTRPKSGWEKNMDENLLQVREYGGEGFQSLVEFNGWRVAILNYLDDIHPEHNDTLERHTETDEVFVLTRGKGILIIGGNGPGVETLIPQVMKTGKIYNVRCNTWHTILLSREASVLLVEERDTGIRNSEYLHISREQQGMIVRTAQLEGIEA